MPHRHPGHNPRFGKPLVRLNFEQLKEADFRFSLVRIRENAEAIAFTGAKSGVEPGQTAVLEAFDNVKRLLIWELNLNILTNAYEFIPFILQVVALLSLRGEMEVGKVSEAQEPSFGSFSLNVVVARFQA